MSDSNNTRSEDYKNGYSRGYTVGRRRRKRDICLKNEYKERMAFKDKAFISVLPFAMKQDGWKFGEEPIKTPEDRIKLAWVIANKTLIQRGK